MISNEAFYAAIEQEKEKILESVSASSVDTENTEAEWGLFLEKLREQLKAREGESATRLPKALQKAAQEVDGLIEACRTDTIGALKGSKFEKQGTKDADSFASQRRQAMAAILSHLSPIVDDMIKGELEDEKLLQQKRQAREEILKPELVLLDKAEQPLTRYVEVFAKKLQDHHTLVNRDLSVHNVVEAVKNALIEDDGSTIAQSIVKVAAFISIQDSQNYNGRITSVKTQDPADPDAEEKIKKVLLEHKNASLLLVSICEGLAVTLDMLAAGESPLSHMSDVNTITAWQSANRPNLQTLNSVRHFSRIAQENHKSLEPGRVVKF